MGVVTTLALLAPVASAAPDLVVTAVYFLDDGAGHVVPEEGRFRAYLENRGDEPAVNFSVRWAVHGEESPNETRVDRLDPGEQRVVESVEWRLEHYTGHSFTATVDPGNEVQETDEGNNAVTNDYRYMPGPGFGVLALAAASAAVVLRRRR